MIIYTDRKEIQAQEINILIISWPLFALDYLGISDNLTEILPAHQTPVWWASGIYTSWHQRKSLLEELMFPLWSLG